MNVFSHKSVCESTIMTSTVLLKTVHYYIIICNLHLTFELSIMDLNFRTLSIKERSPFTEKYSAKDKHSLIFNLT